MPQFFDKQELFLILPPVMLAIFGLGILLADFWLKADEKRYSALLALAGVAFSGYTLWLQAQALLQDRKSVV